MTIRCAIALPSRYVTWYIYATFKERRHSGGNILHGISAAHTIPPSPALSDNLLLGEISFYTNGRAAGAHCMPHLERKRPAPARLRAARDRLSNKLTAAGLAIFIATTHARGMPQALRKACANSLLAASLRQRLTSPSLPTSQTYSLPPLPSTP